MRFLLRSPIAPRSWRLVPYAYCIRNTRNARGLTKDEYDALSHCDGCHDMENNHLLTSLIGCGL